MATYATPSVPVPFVAGLVTIPVNRVVGLLELIWQQLEPNCPGASSELALTADETNGVPILLGAWSRLAGSLSYTNWGFALSPGDIRVYSSAYPGSSTPLGRIQVLASAQVALHVEVQS